MREIGKDGKVWRLSKESWDFLIPFDSDPNEALKKIQAQMKAKPAIPDTLITHSCRFDEAKIKIVVKEAVEEVIQPLTGG